MHEEVAMWLGESARFKSIVKHQPLPMDVSFETGEDEDILLKNRKLITA